MVINFLGGFMDQSVVYQARLTGLKWFVCEKTEYEWFKTQAGYESRRLFPEPVTFVWHTTIRDFLESNIPEDQVQAEWTRGHEECKRRILNMLELSTNQKIFDELDSKE